MDNSTAQLQSTVTTPVTNTINNPEVPSDLATADLSKVQGSFDALASSMSDFGGALSKDVQSRQELLIGNNFSPDSGVGDLNYDTYYESGVASGANAIKSAGTKIALKEGMRRAEEAAKARTKKAQDDYNSAVARKNAEAAQAARQQAQQRKSTGDVKNITIDPKVLKEKGVSSAEDLARLHPDVFERELKKAADSKAGVTDENVWKFGTSHWYNTADNIYKQFGATAEQMKDERSGKQTQASKDFWAREDVGKAFSASMLNQAGYARSYYDERNKWVGDVQTKVYDLIKDGGEINKINDILKNTEFSFSITDAGFKDGYKNINNLKNVVFKDDKQFNAILEKLSDGDRKELQSIRDSIDKASEAAGGVAEGNRDSAVAEALNSLGYKQGAAGLFNRALELSAKSGVGVTGNGNGEYLVASGATLQKATKKEVKRETRTMTVNAASTVTGLMGISAEDIASVSRWRQEDPASLNRYLETAYRASSMPLSISDGSLTDLNGNAIEAGTAVIFQMPGSDKLTSYTRLVEILKQKPVIYDDMGVAYGWEDIEEVSKYYEAYIIEANANSFYAEGHGFAPSEGTAKGVTYSMAYSQMDESNPLRDKAARTAADKIEFGGKKMRDYNTGDDIITRFSSLAGDQKRDFYKALVKRSEYGLDDAKSRIKEDGKFHGVVNDDISADDARGLLIAINMQQAQVDPSGRASGTFKPADLDGSRLSTFWEGVGTASQQGINFLAGAATGLFGVPLDVINKLNGNAEKQGYVSESQRGYEIAQGGNGKGIVTFADGSIRDMMDMREEENMAIFSGFGKYYSDHANWYGVGEAAQFVGSIAVGFGSTALLQMASRAGAGAITSVAGKTAEKLGLKLETKAGAGVLSEGTTLKSGTMDIVSELTPSSAKDLKKLTKDIQKSTNDEIVASKATIGEKTVTTKTIDETSINLDTRISPTAELMIKNVAKAQLLEAGAKEAAYNSVNRWVRSTAVTLYNGGTDASRKLAGDLINLAYDAQKSGAKFTPTDAFKFAAKHVESGSAMGVRGMYHLAQEAKWYGAYTGWQFATEVGERDTGKYARYMDEDGNFDFKKAADFQGGQLLGDAVVAGLGYGLLGPGLRSIKGTYYEGKLNKWSSIRAATEEGTEAHRKANQKIESLYNKTNKFVQEAGAKFLLEGDTPRFRSLLARAEEDAGAVVEELGRAVALPTDAKGAVMKSLTMDEAVNALQSKVGFKSQYMRSIATLKVTRGLKLNKLRSEMPTITNLTPLESLQAMRAVYDEVALLGKSPSKQDVMSAEIRAFEKFGVPAAETQFLRAQYDRTFTRMQKMQADGKLPKGDDGELVKERQIYYSMAALETPVDTKIEDSFLGLDLAGGITQAPKSYKERSATDMVVLIDNAIARMTKQQKAKGEILVGEKATAKELNVAKANPVTGLHAYINKIDSDERIAGIRDSRFGRWDVVRVVDDEVYDANFATDAQFMSRMNRRIRRAPEYRKLVDSAAAVLTSGNGTRLWTPEKTRQLAESYFDTISSGVVTPSDIRFLRSIAKDNQLVDNFLEDYTGLHLRSAQYERVYRQNAKNMAVAEYKSVTGLIPDAAMLKDLDRAVSYRWDVDYAKPVMGVNGKAPKNIKTSKSDAPITVDSIAEDTAAAQFETPAQIFNRVQDAQDRYLNTAAQFEGMRPEVDDLMFGAKLSGEIESTASDKLLGREYSMLDLITNNERIPTILATSPKGMAKKIEAALANSKVVFIDTKGAKNGEAIYRDVTTMADGEGFTINLDAATIRKNGGSIESTLAHEFIHVLDMADLKKFGPKFFESNNRLAYYRRTSEARGHAVSALLTTEATFKRQLQIYENMLSYRSTLLPDMVVAAKDAGVKLDYKKVVDDFGEGSVSPVTVGDNGITYMRRSDFEKSDMAQRYEGINAVSVDAKGRVDDSEISKNISDGIENSVRKAEISGGVNGSTYLAKDYADMIRTYKREGGDFLGKDSIPMKIGGIMNEITQLQLAAGYSIFNAYTARQFISALGASVLSNPKQTVKLFKTYGYAGSIDKTRKYFANPEKRNFLTEMSLLTGDTTILDVTSDIVATTAAMRTGVADEMIKRIKDAAANGMIDGKRMTSAMRGQIDAIHRVVDDPTFKRFLPILMLETMQNTFIRRTGQKYGRTLNKSMFAGDETRLKQVMLETYEEWQMFWGLNVGTRNKAGGISAFQTDKNAKFLSGRARGNTFTSIASGVFFALQYRLTNAARFINGLASLSPTTWKDKRYAGSRSLLASGLAIIVAAQIWNASQGNETDLMKAVKEGPSGDPNSLTKILTDFGTMGRFDTGFNDIQIDPFFSVFTMQNSIFREGIALRDLFVPPDRRAEGVQGLGQELNSLLLSPLRAAVEIATNTTYFGYSIYGEGASAFNDETGQIIEYSPLDNVMAIMGHFTGLDRFGVGANMTYRGAEMQAGRNARGEMIGGSGILQHEYLDAIDAATDGNWFGGVTTALEMPFRKNNLTNKAMASMNGWVKESFESYYKDYKKKVDEGNLSKEEKDQLYKDTMSKMMNVTAIWNDRYNVLDKSPHLVERMSKLMVGFMSDQWDDNIKRIRNAYWAAGVDALGGFDRKKDETDEEYDIRKQKVSDAYGAAAEKERAARNVLRSLGYDPSGYDYVDDRSKRYKSRDSINFQFKQVVEGKIDGVVGLKDTYFDYTSRIQSLRAAGNKAGAAELEAEYMNKFESIVAPYVKEYGAGILLRNKDFTDMASQYVIIPSADFRKYSGENGKKNWLQDRYGVGFKDSSALISDTGYMEAYQRLVRETLTGNSALAQAKAEDMLKAVASGKYTVSDKQYNQLSEIFSKLRNHNK